MADWAKYWGAIGVAELLIIGTLFFLFPEPITSTLGVGLILVAVGVWVAGWFRGDDHDEPEHREHRDQRVRR